MHIFGFTSYIEDQKMAGVISKNITFKDFIIIKRVAQRCVNERFSNFNTSMFYDESISTK